MVDQSALRKTLEDRAREIAQKTLRNRWDDSLEGILGRQIALAVDDIQKTRERLQAEQRELLKLECYIGTDIARLVPLGRYYYDPNIDRRGRLKRHLVDIQREKIRLKSDREAKLLEMETKLLELVEQYSQVAFDNGN